MTFRHALRDELRILVEQHLAHLDPIAPGDVDAVERQLAAYEARLPELHPVRAELAALIDLMAPLTKELVVVRKACGDSLREARDAHGAAEQALARAETIASETP
jgi:hypothetical protein